ncbi:hypothetical protein ACH4TP_39205 [Streptomyces sp. NPDC021012]|uniref:hypothetical protein n=1 Tax=Streptomyces sp. NPDC021012 TaxID=3365107 RepID=UPI0037B2D52B
MSESDARILAEGLIGEYLAVTSVTQRHGKFYVFYNAADEGGGIGGNVPLEVDPETGQHRFISIDEYFELDL